MNRNDILGASLLDILFDNRNKQYGAYELRQNYNQRMMYGLGIAIGLTGLLLFLGFNFNSAGTTSIITSCALGPVELTEVNLEQPPAQPQPAVKPAAPQPPVATEHFTSTIEIVKDNVPIESALPPQTDLINAAIGTQHIEGDAPTTVQQSPITETGTGAAPAAIAEEKIYDFTAVEKAAEFPGGMEAFQRFLARHLQTPEELTPDEKKTVQVRFVIQKDGAVLDMAVLRSAGPAYDNEVIRVLKKLPRWKPARQNGHDVAVAFTLPVTFVSSEE